MVPVTYRTTNVNGLSVFYRESGPSEGPKLLLLHGYPTAGHMFRNLIPQLADRFHVIAPDLVGFGQSDMPGRDRFTYTFEALTDVLEGFTDAVGFDRYALYVFDYGAPTGFRLAVRRPGQITAVISQNGNAYDEGLSEGWNPIRAYWKEPSQANRDAIRSLVQPETTVWQYTHGVPDPSLVSPDGYTLDNYYLTRTGADEIQLDLFLNYATNIDLYPKFQDYLRTHQPPLLAIWGRNDPFFLPAGAQAFRRDVPQAEVRLLDTGHFALETHAAEIAEAIREFLVSRA
jgi:pimeloyl-ACP methyl ester carboxylesterase